MPQMHHSDVIGSLLRPKYLQQARDAYAAGQLPAPDFKRIEDRAVDQAIAMQEGIGFDVITDGELRRFSFFDQITFELEGMGPGEGAGVHFRNATDKWIWHSPVVVTAKLSQKRKVTIEEFAYSRARAAGTVKVTLPGPLFIYSLWSPEQSTAAYRDPYEMFADVAAIIKAEAILGLVSSKTTTLEPVAGLEARVREAAKYTGFERLGVSTQCGFSSTLPGANLTNVDVQERKLELVAELAHRIW